MGIIGPLLLFVHSTRLGFGYLMLLTGFFIGSTLLGLASPRAFPRLRQFSTSWLTLHVALSLTVVVLMGYHLWMALAFE